MVDKEGDAEARIKELEAAVASLTKQNTKLKNELRFTTETERRKSGEYIASLKRDVDALKSRNDQISSALMQADAQIKAHEVSQAKVKASSSAKMAAHSAALVERLSSAQRERERSLASQLRQIMEEKQQLLKKIEESGLQISLNSEQNESTDEADTENENDLVKIVATLETTKGVFELQQVGDKLVKRLKAMREEEKGNIQSKIDMLKQESQEANLKKDAAEEKIGRLKRQLEMLKTEYKLVDKTRIKSLQAQLQTAQAERESWQRKAEKFEDTCETLRVLSSLQKSMSKEEDIKRKYEGELMKSQQDIEHLKAQATQILQERNELIQERAQLIHQCQEEYERAEKFQRLVVVLRRKLGIASKNSDKSPSPSTQVYDI